MTSQTTEQLPPWHAEIIALHDFFQGWLDGTLPARDAIYARLKDTQDPAFTIIGPDGSLITGQQLFDAFRHAHGTRPGWRMWIERAELRHSGGDLRVVTYEEWHRQADGVVTARLSTAIFRVSAGAPNGLVWLHVHETWMPGHAPPAL